MSQEVLDKSKMIISINKQGGAARFIRAAARDDARPAVVGAAWCGIGSFIALPEKRVYLRLCNERRRRRGDVPFCSRSGQEEGKVYQDGFYEADEQALASGRKARNPDFFSRRAPRSC